MMIQWDTGAAVAGDGTQTGVGSYYKFHLTTIPTSLSRSGSSPELYRFLGRAGYIAAGVYLPGEAIQWPDQLLGPAPAAADSVWYRLVAGVSGTLYTGAEVSNEIAIGARVNNSALQSIPDNTTTVLTFDQERQDPYGLHSPSVNPGRLTVPVPGWYVVGVAVKWEMNATGIRSVSIRVNGATSLGKQDTLSVGAGNQTYQSFTTVVWLDQGDYVEATVRQNSGVALNVEVEVQRSPEAWIARL